MKAILLAGGGGTRLWPLSRENFPKQFLGLGQEHSLLQKSVLRLCRAAFISDVIIVTNTLYSFLVQEQIRKIGMEERIKILVEPLRRNTAPAVALSLKYLETMGSFHPLDPILILPSDHFIESEAIFLETIERAQAAALKGWIVTFGIRPTKAETGYGYIECAEPYDELIFHTLRFVEKPDRATAEIYLSNPQFYWSAGIFLFSAKTFWEELALHGPDLSSQMQGSFEAVLERFSSMTDISIDYALMEKTKKILLCPLVTSWSDVGSWDNVYEAFEKDENRNVKIGQVIDIETKNSLIVGGKRLISTIGVEDLLIVETPDALFISKKGESQRVRSLVKELARCGRKEGVSHKTETFPWGFVTVLDTGTGAVVKKVTISPYRTMDYPCLEGVEHEWASLGNEKIPLDSKLENQSPKTLEYLLIERSTHGQRS